MNHVFVRGGVRAMIDHINYTIVPAYLRTRGETLPEECTWRRAGCMREVRKNLEKILENEIEITIEQRKFLKIHVVGEEDVWSYYVGPRYPEEYAPEAIVDRIMRVLRAEFESALGDWKEQAAAEATVEVEGGGVEDALSEMCF